MKRLCTELIRSPCTEHFFLRKTDLNEPICEAHCKEHTAVGTGKMVTIMSNLLLVIESGLGRPSGLVDLDGKELTKDVFRKCCSYVEQVLR